MVGVAVGKGTPTSSCVSTGSALAARSALCLAAVRFLPATADVLVLRELARWRFDVLFDDVRGITHFFLLHTRSQRCPSLRVRNR